MSSRQRSGRAAAGAPRSASLPITADCCYRHDRLSSTRYLTDGLGSQTVATERCDAFGNRTFGQGTDTGFANEFLFAGGWGYQAEPSTSGDPGLGLDYLNQRYYDPLAGRFISPDPIGFDGGPNLYAYAGNNPVGRVDPSGREFEEGPEGWEPEDEFDPFERREPPGGVFGRVPGRLAPYMRLRLTIEEIEAGRVRGGLPARPIPSIEDLGADVAGRTLPGLGELPGGGAGGPSECDQDEPTPTGQWHHVLSNRIIRALELHRTLRGKFQREDIRFLVRALNLEARKGYETWHRDYDTEVEEWLAGHDAATPSQFLGFLSGVHERPALQWRFPGYRIPEAP